MSWLLVAVVVVYPLALVGVSLWRSGGVKTHEDFMVAGRDVPVALLVGTLVCTWIGSGSLFGGAGLAYDVGIGELWFSFGGWMGLLVAFFLAGRVRRIAQYTVPDLLEQRYNAAARVLGTLAIILAYVTIASYQFRGGGWILSIVTDGFVGPTEGMLITAGVIVAFTALAGMVSIVTVDIFNGILIILAIVLALPYLVFSHGGVADVMANLPTGHTDVLGGHNVLWVFGVSMPTFLLILGESGMYQKFFSARDEDAARRAVVGMVLGIMFIEITLALVAIVGRAIYPDLAEVGTVVGAAASETVILYVARHALPLAIGAVLLAAGVAIVLSTGNTFLLVPSTNVARDIYERFVNPEAAEEKKLAVQRAFVVLFGGLGLLLLTQFDTVLDMALYAYSLVGASLTPALLAAFLWKRVTKEGGVACIAGGLGTIGGIALLDRLRDDLAWLAAFLDRIGLDFTATIGGTEFDFASSDYVVIPGVLVSVTLLVVVSLMNDPSPEEKWKPFFQPPEEGVPPGAEAAAEG